ncbi:MAG: AraC family transcriptional regulator [Streptococcaceae bacterium]|jgi:AraC-like DNA-binding protein|nr:AraC family transcriptional regulator [Streptococcaceae bacterium]
MEQAIFNHKNQYFLQSDLYFTFCGFSKTLPMHAFGPSSRNHFILHIVLDGKGVYYVKNQMFPLKAGDLFLIRPDELTFYQADKQNPWVYAWIGFGGKTSKQIINHSIFSNNQYVLSNQKANNYAKIIKNCLNLTNETFEEEVLLNQNIYKILSLLLQEKQIKMNTSSKVSELTRKTIDYVQQQLPQSASVQMIADELNVNRSHLSRTFSKDMGMNLKNWLLSLKINKASQLLITTDKTIEQIAFDSGFASLVAFSRAFKQMNNENPMQYRKRSKNINRQDEKRTIEGIFDLLAHQEITTRAT